jgi:hypothetical protein
MTDENTAATEEVVDDKTVAAETDSETATEQVEGEAQGEAKDDGEGGEEAANGAPEKYEAFTLPEGYALEGERLDKATGLFKELNLSQEQGQKLVDAFVAADSENRSMLDELREAETAKRIESWGKEAREQFGKDYDAAVADARKAVTAVKSEALDKAFNEHGWGNHPELIRAFAYFGRLVGGSQMDGMEGQTAGEGQPEDARKRWYPDLAK